MSIFEKRGLVRERLSIGAGLLEMGDQEYVVTLNGMVEEPKPGVRVTWLEFLGVDSEKMDAAYITVEPGCATPIEMYTGVGGSVDGLVRGSGVLILTDQDGETAEYEFGVDEDIPEVVVMGKGSIACWVAGEYGAEILRVYAPGQRKAREIVTAEVGDITVEDRFIPHLFQAYYEELTGIEWEGRGTRVFELETRVATIAVLLKHKGLIPIGLDQLIIGTYYRRDSESARILNDQDMWRGEDGYDDKMRELAERYYPYSGDNLAEVVRYQWRRYYPEEPEIPGQGEVYEKLVKDMEIFGSLIEQLEGEVGYKSMMDIVRKIGREISK